MDWTIGVTIASLIGTIANIHKKQWCFAVWLFTNCFWCIYDFSKGLYSQSLLFFVYTGLAIWGLVKWRRIH
jgi:nicotinamide riboside transporter PnuC